MRLRYCLDCGDELVKKSATHYKSTYNSPSGFAEYREDFISAAWRKMFEETPLAVGDV